VLDIARQGRGRLQFATLANCTLTMGIPIDWSSAEIFASDGTAMTTAVYPRYEQGAQQLVGRLRGRLARPTAKSRLPWPA
jgi:hypothetical protein